MGIEAQVGDERPRGRQEPQPESYRIPDVGEMDPKPVEPDAPLVAKHRALESSKDREADLGLEREEHLAARGIAVRLRADGLELVAARGVRAAAEVAERDRDLLRPGDRRDHAALEGRREHDPFWEREVVAEAAARAPELDVRQPV